MKYPWHGRAERASEADFNRTAQSHGIARDALTAVWLVEAGGKPFRADGSLTRRYEPHHNGVGTWRDSLRIPTAKRDAMFMSAYQSAPDAALRATSWGGPQIMGFNAKACGYDSAAEMVQDFARSEAAQIEAFARFCAAKGLTDNLASRDWLGFARAYNGPGKAADYAAKMEAAYRRQSGGDVSPVVLRMGDSGEAVKRLQRALGVPDDGHFGPTTDRAVRAHQASHGLPVDGVVGAKTWGTVGGSPTVQPASIDAIAGHADKAARVVAVAGTAAEAARGFIDGLPDVAQTILISAIAVAGLVVAGAWAWRRVRGLA